MPPRRIRPVEPGPPNRTEHHFWLTRVQRSSRGRRWGAWDGGYGAAECHPITLYAPVPYAPRPFPPPYLLISRMSEYGRNRENRPFSPICPCCITFLLTGLIQHGQAAPASHSAQRRLRCELWPSPGAQTAPGTDPRAPRAPSRTFQYVSLVPTLCFFLSSLRSAWGRASWPLRGLFLFGEDWTRKSGTSRGLRTRGRLGLDAGASGPPPPRGAQGREREGDGA